MIKLIPANTRIKCDHCSSVSQIPVEIIPGHLPIYLTCQHCKGQMFWDRMPILPRIPPCDSERKLPLQLWSLHQSIGPHPIVAPPIEPVPENPQESASETPKENAAPFWQLALRAGNLTRELFEHVELMRAEMDKFARTVGHHFAYEWVYATRFARHWERQYLQEFLDWPFVSIPVKCDDELAKSYGRWILSPKFFNPGLGMKVHHHGGFRLELLTSYTRMMFPLETEWCSIMEVPPPLDLHVIENKILGPSLQFCWKDIPGLTEDRDSTEEWASVYMSNCKAARMWLAQHGVSPWEPKKFQLQELTDREIDREISKQPLYMDAWRLFNHYGRLATFWPSIMESRRFACLAALMLKGVTCIFVAGQQDYTAWMSMFSQYQNTYHGTMQELVFFNNDTPTMWDAVLRAKSVIIDLANDTRTDILDRFFNYHGHLMIINSDPIWDYFTTNDLIGKVFALTGAQSFEAAYWEDWPTQHMKDLDIKDTFNALAEHWQGRKLPRDVSQSNKYRKPISDQASAGLVVDAPAESGK